MPLYLGLDSSTQSLTAIVIEVEGSARRVVLERTLKLSDAFPIYRTKSGVIVGRDHREVTAPPLMWVAALDLMLGEIATTLGPDLSRIRAISASAQQHGTVYLGADWTTRLAALNPRRLLAPQLRGMFTRRQSPVWMDSSTTEQCESITKALGGAARVAELTGSRETERFSGPQIRKMCERHAEAYDKTVRIHLVSSFIGALLVGHDGPVDAADASGMNLMDLRARAWSPEALKATARWLARKLPPIVASHAPLGEASTFWQKRYHFPAARVIASSGDNPCSLIGLGLITPGDRAISLGTSDTMFCAMHEPTIDPSGSGNVFVSPTGEYMSLLAWRNGSLARDRIRTAFDLTWDQFSAKLRATPPGNSGALMLPWFEPEITPRGPAVVTRHNLASGDVGANVRGVVEGQALSMLIHSRWMGKLPKRIRATGGGSANRDALQVVADVFGAEVVRQEGTNAAALGAALRAMHGDQLARGEPMEWDEVVEGFSDPSPEPPILPRAELGKMYQRMAKEMEGLIAEL